MTDPRVTPANGRVAHVSLKGRVVAETFVEGEWARVTRPLADLLRAPDGRRDRQLLMGDRVLVLEKDDRHAYVMAEKDGYCGYLADAVLGLDHPVTHWVAAPATHLYASPSIKPREVGSLSFGARLWIQAEHDRFFETRDGLFAHRQHLKPAGDRLTDPVAVAEMFLGTPYLWGGNSRGGLDCSGLVQTACLGCGISCPGDSDLQFAALGRPADGPYRRGDLVFWTGHVALVADAARLIHANGHTMSVAYEGIDDALARIARQEGPGAFLGVRRL